MSFAPGSRVELGVAVEAFTEVLERWMETEGDSFIIPFPQPDFFDYPSQIDDYLISGYALSIQSTGKCSIIGVSREPETRPFDSLQSNSDTISDFYGFRKRALTGVEVETIGQYVGYPVQVTAKWIARNLYGASITAWISGDRGDADVRRNPGAIACFLGALNASNTGYNLINQDGSDFVLGNRQAFSQRLNRALVPAPIWVRTRLNNEFSYDFATEVLPQVSNVNGISEIRFLTKPGRRDLDGFIQPAIPGYVSGTPGPIPIRRAVARSEPFKNFNVCNARVVTSEVLPEISDPLQGLIIQPSSHVIEVEVSDRAAIGLGETPQQVGISRQPDAMVDDRPFFIDRIGERENKQVVLTLSSRRLA